ncbi:alpha-L-rhamnosidase N-terminal domain-containing protein [Colwellia piezophila]|uniref:alpha-L-rhamnosidase-related protein n=1 Tax=Colwellia piezophila TaxID=211668 RepID=UPI00037CC8CB|nr:alpha-L-rhamnosidase N-terminal domain-containing protein [Colwellia piezophila]
MSIWLRFLYCFSLVIFCGTLQAQSNYSLGGNQNSSIDSQPTRWQAKWLWGHGNSSMQLFRRSFEIKGKPVNATLHISASSVYQLYVNGVYISRGPARSAPHHQSYDTWQLESLLTEGENLIAVKVHFKDSVNSYQHQTRAGLLAQLSLQTDDEATIIISDENWLTHVDASWDVNEIKMSRFHQQVNDLVDLNKSLKNWQQLDFNDNGWRQAQVLMRNVGWPKPQKNDNASSFTPPWTALVARDIPKLNENKVRAKRLIFAGQVDDYLLNTDTFPKKLSKIPIIKLNNKIAPLIESQINNWHEDGSITLPKSARPWLLVFDFGQVRNGLPFFKLQGAKGSKVEVISKPFMLNNEFGYHTIDSNLIDQVYLSGEQDTWQATYFKPARYLGLLVSTEKKPLTIDDFGIHEISYPFELKGKISSQQSPWLDKYMQATAKTIKAATTDAFTDNYRERRQYSQTGFYAALGNYYLFADQHLQRRYLLQVAQEQYANGLMPAYAPQMNNNFMVILDSNLLWLSSLHHYFLYTGDEKTVRDLLPSADKLLGLLANYTNEDGLLDEPPFAYWLDHAKNDRRGANLTLNGHYLHALENYAQVLEWLGVKGSDNYRQQAKRMRKAIQNKFWHQKKGLFVDALINNKLGQGKQSSQFSEHANAMALALNIATKEQANRVIKHLLKDDDNNLISRFDNMTVVTPAMSYYLHKGIANYGYIDESFALLNERFAHMLSPQYNGTFWEEWWLNGTGRSGKFVDNGRTRSDAQTESAFAPALFAQFLVGVEPISPGMKTIKLFNRFHSFANLTATIPTPYGKLKINWLKDANQKQLKITIPKGVQVELDPVTFSGNSYAGTTLSAGVHQFLLTNIQTD